MKILRFTLFVILLTNNSFAQCWTQIAAGDSHSLALKSNGTLWAWGLNDKGQLGDGTTVNKTVPTQIGTDTDWVAIDAMGSNSIALKTNGTLWAWGDNSAGQNGNGNHGDGAIDTIPTQIGTDTDWEKFALGSFAIKSNGTLWGWNTNQNGELGTGDMIPHYTPYQIGTDTDWLDISVGAHRLALKTNRSVWGWGLNKQGALAIGNPNDFIFVPTQTGNNTADWDKIEAGGCCSSKMIKTDGSLWAMGNAETGNLGTGGTTNVNTPTRVGTDNDWSMVSTDYHTCAIRNNGSLWAWGFNFYGEVGDGSNINRNVPTQIASNQTWLTVKVGALHSIAISSDRSLYTWGRNASGQLGDGTLANKNVPTLIGNSCPLGTANFDDLKALKAYPNPSKDKITLQYTLTQETLVNISVTNSLGQLMLHQSVNNNSGEQHQPIDLTSYSSGVYLITIYTNNLRNTIKIIKN